MIFDDFRHSGRLGIQKENPRDLISGPNFEAETDARVHPWEASNSHIERVSVPSMRPVPIMLCASYYLPVPATTTTRLRNDVSTRL